MDLNHGKLEDGLDGKVILVHKIKTFTLINFSKPQPDE